MNYRLSFARPSEQIIQVQITAEARSDQMTFCLPFWRPGRYAAQSYARNLSDVVALDERQNPLPITRISNLQWLVRCQPGQNVQLQYHYYAHQLDAGGSYYDADHIYLNGINLLMYLEDRIDEACTLQLDMPAHFRLGGALHGNARHHHFADYHQLVDSPFFAAADMQSRHFEVEGLGVYLWFVGACKPDFAQMETDIRAYTAAQLQFFGECPVTEYHYLYYLLPYPYRHGVEHYNSTVIVMGPAYRLMEAPMYKSFLEISSHEFFHTWNVKALRPTDMLPYRYGTENYSHLHYVTEGVTTYYGDLMLWKSGVWGPQQWLDSINGELRQHYRMGGKDHISLSQASFESWINGYDDQGMPNRRISFYTKGYLVAMLLDFALRRATSEAVSLDTVMYELYHRFVRGGYRREDYLGLIESLSGTSFEAFFADYVEGTHSLDDLLEEMAEYYGLQLHTMPLGSLEESGWGLSVRPQGKTVVVDKILPESPVLAAGLQRNDEIISINHTRIDGDWNELLAYHWSSDKLVLHLFRQNRLRAVELHCPAHFSWYVPQFWLIANQEEPHKGRFQAWQSLPKR